jgi:hypothetical protein
LWVTHILLSSVVIDRDKMESCVVGRSEDLDYGPEFICACCATLLPISEEVGRDNTCPFCETREQRTVLPTNIIMPYLRPRGENFNKTMEKGEETFEITGAQ